MKNFNTLWRSPEVNKKQKEKDLSKLGNTSYISLKIQIILFMCLMIEFSLNLIAKIIGLSQSNKYLYILVCKTLLLINLIFIMLFTYQLISTQIKLYLMTLERNFPEINVYMSVLYDTIPKSKEYIDQIKESKLYKRFYGKELNETELKEKLKKRTKELFHPISNNKWFGAANNSYNSGFISADIQNISGYQNGAKLRQTNISNNSLFLTNSLIQPHNNSSNLPFMDISNPSLKSNQSVGYISSTPFNSFCKPFIPDISPVVMHHSQNDSCHSNSMEIVQSNSPVNSMSGRSPLNIPVFDINNNNNCKPYDYTHVKHNTYKYSPLKSLNRFKSTNMNNKGFVEIEYSKIWQKLGINEQCVDLYLMNLKQWIHSTIIISIVQEINAINERLEEMGIYDVSIGHSSLQTLRALAQKPCNNLPTLSTLIGFLDVSKDQAYVVNRLRELSQGLTLGKFEWNGGSKHSVHYWREYLPNDATLILHLIGTYIDTKHTSHSYLQPLTTTFSQNFVVENIDKLTSFAQPLPISVLHPTINGNCKFQSPFQNILPSSQDNSQSVNALLQVQIQPPHYKVISDYVIYDVMPGRRNLFECLLVFFYNIRNNDSSYKWLNMGRSGLNINWVFEKDD